MASNRSSGGCKVRSSKRGYFAPAVSVSCTFPSLASRSFCDYRLLAWVSSSSVNGQVQLMNETLRHLSRLIKNQGLPWKVSVTVGTAVHGRQHGPSVACRYRTSSTNLSANRAATVFAQRLSISTWDKIIMDPMLFAQSPLASHQRYFGQVNGGIG